MSKKAGSFDGRVFRRVLSFALPYRGLFFGSAAATLLLVVISPIRPRLVEYTINHFVVHPNKQGIIQYSLYNVGLLLLEILIGFLAVFSNGFLGQQIIRDIRMQLFEKLITFRPSFFDKNPIGTLVTRVISDIQNIADVFSQGFLEIGGDILKIIVITGMMLYSDVGLTLISLSTIPLLMYATVLFKNAINASFSDVRTAVAMLNIFVQEQISGMMLVQSYVREKQEARKFFLINAAHRTAHIRSNQAYSVFFPVVELLSALSVGLLIWWGSRGSLAGHYSPGTLVAFIMYIQMLFRPIRMLADRFNTLQMGMICAERVFQLLETDESVADTGRKEAGSIKGKIEFRGVWFSYGNDENWVLRDVSFVVMPGQSLAIVGETGSGKSTIISLLNRFYEPQKGVVLIDDVPIQEYSISSLRQRISLVLQDVFLFSDTILENIRMGNNSITEERVTQAAEQLGVANLTSHFSGGWQVNVQERGAALSTGQRQIITFIRAYLRKPAILVLDEATANIDSESEKKIQQATQKLMDKQTSVIVAHRMSTISHAGCILVLHRGEIKEQGKHEALMQLGGEYHRLFTLQFKNESLEQV